MDKLINSIFYRGINIIEDVLTPLLGDIHDIESAISMRMQGIKAGPSTELRFRNEKDEFTVWITGLDRDTASFRQTRRFKIGYRSGKDEALAARTAKIIAGLIQKNEGSLKDEIYRVVFLDEVTKEPGLELFDGMAELRLTLKCNEKCPFCNTIVDEHTSPVNVVEDRSMIQNLILQAKKQGVKRVVFTGGEPTLLRDLPELLEFTVRHGMDPWIQTNGVLSGSPAFWKRFSVLPNYVFVSFHTTRPQRVRDLTGVGGTFDKKVNALKMLKTMRISFGVNFVVTRINMDEIPLMPDFLANLLGTSGYNLVYSFVAPTGRANMNRGLIPKISEVRGLLIRALDRCRELGIEVEIPEPCGFPRCVMPEHEQFFRANERKRHIDFVASDRVKFPRCRDCKYNPTCIGMWQAYVDTYGDSEFQPVKG